MTKVLLCLMAALIWLCAACSGGKKHKDYSDNRARMEEQAQGMLFTARQQLAAGAPAQAKATIQRMRKDCYLAITAREQAILLMDSVDLSLARQHLAQVDSLRNSGSAQVSQDDFEEACRQVQFYERKIKYDHTPHP